MKTAMAHLPRRSHQPSLYPTFKEWKLKYKRFNHFNNLRVYILPLRNENLTTKNILLPLRFVYILPLRNENLGAYTPQQERKWSLYPTFKEWKQIKFKFIRFIWSGLYPTFKEWKHIIILSIISIVDVYILPLRNEN